MKITKLEKVRSFPSNWRKCGPFVHTLLRRENVGKQGSKLHLYMSGGIYLYMYELWKDGTYYKGVKVVKIRFKKPFGWYAIPEAERKLVCQMIAEHLYEAEQGKRNYLTTRDYPTDSAVLESYDCRISACMAALERLGGKDMRYIPAVGWKLRRNG